MRTTKTEQPPSPRKSHETFRIVLVVLGVGTLTLWTYWQTLFFFSGQNQLQHASNGASIMLRAVVPLWLACFFPALGLGLGLYTFTHRLPRNASSSLTRPGKDYMTETQTYIMLCTAICLFSVNYRILPLFPLMNYGADRVTHLLITFPWGAANLWGGMTVLGQQAFTGALGVVVVILQAWWVIQKRGGSRRTLGLLAASLLVVGLLIPWSGCLSLMPMFPF
jgi:hypothetical protein